MSGLSILACSFHTRKKNKKEIEAIRGLNKEFDNKEGKTFSDFFGVFEEFWEKHTVFYDNKDEKKMFSFDKNVKIIDTEKNFKYFMGKVNAGSYGIESEITDKKSKKVVHKRKNTEADIKPFYFFLAIPTKNEKYEIEKGIFIFQNIGVYGIKTIMMDYLKSYLTKNYNTTLYCGNICPEAFLEQLINKNDINKVTLIKNNVSKDIADNIGIGYGREERTYSKVMVTKEYKDKMIKFAKNSNTVFEIGENKYDQVKINIKDASNRIRTINLNNIKKLSVIESIPNNVADANGHLDETKMLEFFKDITNEYMEKMVFKVTS